MQSRRGRLATVDKSSWPNAREVFSRRRAPTGVSTLAYAAGVALGKWPGRLDAIKSIAAPKPICKIRACSAAVIGLENRR